MSNIEIDSGLELRTPVYSESIKTSKVTTVNRVLLANYSAFLQKKKSRMFLHIASFRCSQFLINECFLPSQKEISHI